jgi:hypothetical protein
MFDPSQGSVLDQLAGLQAQARQKRFADAVANPSSQMGPLPDPKWDAYFQAVNEAGGGKPVKFAGGVSPDESNQLTGIQVPADFTGTEQYGGAHPNYMGRLAGLQSLVQGKR